MDQSILQDLGVDSSSRADSVESRKSSKTRSEVWAHFDKVEDESGATKCRCKYCKKVLHSDTKKNGTSSMKHHLSICKHHPHTIETHQTLLSMQLGAESNIRQSEKVGSSTVVFDQDAVREALCKMIIMDELPFKFVERPGFILFMSIACPLFSIPSRWTISRDIYQLYLNEKMKLRNFFKESSQMVCLTTDTWTSIQRINYMCLTAHWIDNEWKLHKRIINFCSVVSHKGDDLAWSVETCLHDWGIQRVFCITVDNASSNDVMIANIRNTLNNRNGTILQGKFLHMRCVAHIFNLVVTEGLKDIDAAIVRVRNAVRFVRQSPSRLARFQICIEKEDIESNSGLCLDVATRWNSTYLMLEAACKFERAFDRYKKMDSSYRHELQSSDEDGCPSESDWIKVRSLSSFLKVFYDATLCVSGSLYVTSNSFIHELSTVDIYLKESEGSNDFTLSSMAQKMRVKYNKYWGKAEKMNLLIFIAVILDPRYKMDFLNLALTAMYSSTKAAELEVLVGRSLQEMFIEYKTLYGKQGGNASEMEKIPSPNFVENEQSRRGSALRNRFKRMKASSGGEERKTELDKYLSEDVEPDEEENNFDILDYWRVNSARFPIVSKMARDVLAVPISTVASESAFSTGGRILDPFRSSLSPRMVQALVCTQDWLRSVFSHPIISMEEDLNDVEKMERELDKISLEPTITQL